MRTPKPPNVRESHLPGEAVRAGDARRAPRFAIVAPVRFRAGAGHWADGTTVNMGRLGVLLTTGGEERPAPGSRVHLRVMIGAALGRQCAVAACSGTIVRHERTLDGRSRLAVKIDRYALVRPPFD